MKRFHILLVLVLLMALAQPAFAEGEIIINVVDGRFVGGGYDILLADVNSPIEVGVLNGEVIVRITSLDNGTMEFNLGKGQLALSDRAVSYVDLLPEEELTGSLPEGAEICTICGRSTAFGYHKTLDCGHYGCLVTLDHLQICSTCGKFTCDNKDHTPCDYCGVGWCSHVDMECEYTLNPSPTPLATKTPDGKIEYFTIEDDSADVNGAPEGTPEPWAPGETYYEEHDTLGQGANDTNG